MHLNFLCLILWSAGASEVLQREFSRILKINNRRNVQRKIANGIQSLPPLGHWFESSGHWFEWPVSAETENHGFLTGVRSLYGRSTSAVLTQTLMDGCPKVSLQNSLRRKLACHPFPRKHCLRWLWGVFSQSPSKTILPLTSLWVNIVVRKLQH